MRRLIPRKLRFLRNFADRRQNAAASNIDALWLFSLPDGATRTEKIKHR
jgi:hypothetical protein